MKNIIKFNKINILFLAIACIFVNENITATTVTSVTPSVNALNIDKSTLIQVTFSDPVEPSSFTISNFVVTGKSSGRHDGTFTFNGDNTMATFTPSVVFINSEEVEINITKNIKNASSQAITPFFCSFRVSNKASLFSANVDYPVATYLGFVFAKDIDNDNYTDLIVSHVYRDSVSILKNNGDGTFAPKVSYLTGGNAYSLYITDINGDKFNDIVVSTLSKNLSILLNNGDGTFAPKADYPYSSIPSFRDIKDLDGDGDADIAAIYQDKNIVSILLNNGNGIFIETDHYSVGNYASCYIKDIDNDGDNDVFVRNDYSKNTILKNNGDGTFLLSTDIDRNSSLFSVCMDDINGDGDIDIISTDNNAQNLLIIQNRGDGTFENEIEFPIIEIPQFINTADFDGDGDIDLFCTNQDNIAILINDGLGNFSKTHEFPTGIDPYTMFISDFDNDGDCDIVTANMTGKLSVLKGLTAYKLNLTSDHGDVGVDPLSGPYLPGTSITLTAKPYNGYRFNNWSGDLSGSANPASFIINSDKNITANFLVNTNHVNSVTPLMNSSGISKNSSIQIDFNEEMMVSSFNDDNSFIVIGKISGRHTGTFAFTGSNKILTFTPDIAFKYGEDVTVILSDKLSNIANTPLSPVVYKFSIESLPSEGTFSQNTDYQYVQPVNILINDIDKDGDGDFITFNSSNFTIFENNGKGDFPGKTEYNIGKFIHSLSIDDIDNDLDEDIVLSANNSILIYINDGLGSYSVGNEYFIEHYSILLSVEDLDGDGDKDIICQNSMTTLGIFRNNGNGTFKPKETVYTGYSTYSLFVRDIDSDGDMDIAFANYESPKVSILKNKGSASFEPRVEYPISNDMSFSMYMADIDNDMDLDIAVANNDSATVSVLKNNGDGTFTTKIDYNTGLYSTSAAIKDIDGDGYADLIVSSNNNSTISILKNNGDGTFKIKVNYPTGYSPFHIAVDDIDGDGDLDILTSNFGGNLISVLKNEKIYSLTTIASNGSIQRIPYYENLKIGSEVSLSATPHKGYYFTGWSGDTTATTNPINLIIYKNINLIANFSVNPNHVISTYPSSGAIGISADTVIKITFNEEILPATIRCDSTFMVSGRASGIYYGTFAFSNNNKTLIFTPNKSFYKGDIINVVITNKIKNLENIPLSPYSFCFNIQTDSSSGRFVSKIDYNAGALSYYGYINDIDNDSDIDVITSNWADNSISILKNNGDGSFSSRINYKTTFQPTEIFAKDIDNDANADIIVLGSDTISVLFNLGDGTFGKKADYHIKALFNFFINDFDGDGDNDIFVIADNLLFELRNDGAGNFSEKIKHNLLVCPYNPSVSDINNDGIDDIISSSQMDNSIYVFKNKGGIDISNIDQYPATSSVERTYLYDVDADYEMDVIAINRSDNSVSVYKNNDDGTFTAKIDYPAGNFPNDISIIDIDGDNDGDIITSCTYSNSISVLKNNGNGAFLSKTEYNGNKPSEVFTCDINKDGVCDIVSINGNSNTISVLFGYKSPSVTTQSVTNINVSSATLNGKIIKKGVPNITQHGFCWNTTGNPLLSDSKLQLGAKSSTGNFLSTISGLIPSTTYFVRSYAINEEDTAFGEQVTFKTNTAEVSIVGSFSVKDKIYDGSKNATFNENNLSLSGVLSGYSNLFLSNPQIEFADKNAASGKTISIINVELSGSDKDKYILSLANSPTSNASILPKEISISNANVTSKIYDGTAIATITGATLSGIIENDEVTLSNETSGIFDDANVGNAKPVNTSISLNGSYAANYTLIQPSLYGEIKPKALSVKDATVTTKIYDGTNVATITGATLSGIIEDDEVNLSNETSGIFDDVNVGNAKPVTTSISLNGSHAANYTLIQPSLYGEIKPKALSVKDATVVSKIYDGTNVATLIGATLSGIIENDKVNLSNETIGIFDDVNVGNEKPVTTSISLNGSHAANYTLIQPSLYGEIKPKALSVKDATVVSKIYDGTNVATLTGATLSGIIENDEVTLINSTIGTFEDAKANTAKPVTTSMSINGTKAANYSITLPILTGDINKAELILSANNKEKCYGAVNPEFDYIINGFVNNETASVLDTLPIINCNAAQNSIAGTYPIILSGAFDDNYKFKYINGNFIIKSRPTLPVISLIGSTLYSDAFEGNQWYNQEELIINAIEQNFTPTQSGEYYNIVTLLGCSSEKSNVVTFNVNGLNQIKNNKIIKAYPNPCLADLTLECENNNQIIYEIFNELGNIIFKGFFMNKTTIDTKHLKPGIYLIKFIDVNNSEVFTIIKK